MAERDIIIKADNVYKEYTLGSISGRSFYEELLRRKNKEQAKLPQRKKINALNGVSFEIERGEAVGIIGANEREIYFIKDSLQNHSAHFR